MQDFYFDKPVESVSGIPHKTAQILARKIGAHIKDLCLHLPRKVIQRRFIQTLKEARPTDEIVSLEVEVLAHQDGRSLYRVTCFDGFQPLILAFFNTRAPYLKKLLPVGEKRIVSGALDRYQGHVQMRHPEIAFQGQKKMLSGPEPVYTLGPGLGQRQYQQIMGMILERMPEVDEWLREGPIQEWKLIPFREALLKAHRPQTMADIEPTCPARVRLAFDEMVADQLSIALLRAHQKRQGGVAKIIDYAAIKAFQSALPFELTQGQQQVIHDILKDMESPDRMVRMLMGDVGSGKTVVAFCAMEAAIKAGYQAAFLAPTELLARQQFSAAQKTWGDQACLLIGATPSKDKKKIQTHLMDGTVKVVVGTHALIEDTINFQNLGLVVIDEQHRFGVKQRMALMEKGHAVDALVMSATPIPRSLLLTCYGELDVSLLKEKPKNRPKIQTSVLALSHVGQVMAGLKRVIQKNEQVYWVCPLIEESEAIDLADATKRFEEIQKLYPGQSAMLHGQMKAQEKEDIMERFLKGEVKILVSTTVIEVGIDVPHATVMVIEQAERFGLAQLHQLRGRVGRAMLPSASVLLYGPAISEKGRLRLEAMRNTDDGFLIAEEDLKLRGGGDLLGTKQSGLPSFRFADPYDIKMMRAAREEVRTQLEQDPYLTSPLGQGLRLLLRLFDKQAAFSYIKSG